MEGPRQGQRLGQYSCFHPNPDAVTESEYVSGVVEFFMFPAPRSAVKETSQVTTVTLVP